MSELMNLIAGCIVIGFIYSLVKPIASCVHEEKVRKEQGRMFLRDSLQQANREFSAGFHCPDSLEDSLYISSYGCLYGNDVTGETGNPFNVCTMYYNLLFPEDMQTYYSIDSGEGPMVFLTVQHYVQGFMTGIDCYKREPGGPYQFFRNYSREEYIDLLLLRDFHFNREDYLNPHYTDPEEKCSSEHYLGTPWGPGYMTQDCMSSRFLAPFRKAQAVDAQASV